MKKPPKSEMKHSSDYGTIDRQKKILFYVTLSLACILCFCNSLHNGLVHDDIFAIENNPDIRPETPIGNIFTNDFWGRNLKHFKSHKSFRPLCILTFRLNYLFHGLNPYGYHLFNLILHTIVSNYFFFILNTIIFKQLVPSFLAALIFSVHPVHVEAVTGVVGRADVLSCLLFLITFHCFDRHLKHIKLGNGFFSINLFYVLVCGSCALFIKEPSVTVFGVCIAYDVFKHKHLILNFIFPKLYGKHNTNNESPKCSSNIFILIKRIVFMIVWVSILFQYRLYLMNYTLPRFKHEDNPASFEPHLSTRILNYLYLIAFNAKLLMAPTVLSYDWQIGSIPLIESLTDVRNVETLLCISILVIIVATLIVHVLREMTNENDDIILVGLLFLIIPFLPASNFFIRVGFVVAERILYIPSLGFSILVASGFYRLLAIINIPQLKKLCYAVFTALIILFSIKTIEYNKVWYSRETLFRSGIETLPHNAKAHYNYANFLKDQNNSMDAIHHYQHAVRLYPLHSSSHNNLGTLLVDINELEKAEYHFEQAIKHTPGHFRALLNLAGVYSKKRKYLEAEKVLRKCLALSPEYFQAQRLLADILYQNKKMNEAIVLYEKLFTKHGDNDELIQSYATLLQEVGQYNRSISLYTSLLTKDPKNHVLLCSLAKVYQRGNKPKIAKQLYERALTYHQKETSIYQSLAVFHFNRGEIEDASNVYKQMIQYASPNDEHMRNYAVILFQLKQHNEAFAIVKKLLTDDERNLHAHYTIINFIMDISDTKKANDVIEKALNIFPKDLQILVQKANLKRIEKKYDESIKLYKTVLSTNSKHFDALLNLGTVYHILSNYEEANKYYEEALKVNPSNDILAENIKKLKRLIKKKNLKKKKD